MQTFWNSSIEPHFGGWVSRPFLWVYIIVLVILSVGLGLLAFALRSRNQQLEKVTDFYESMFRKLSAVKPPLSIMDEQVVNLITDMLKDLGEALGNFHVRSYLLVPIQDWLVEHSHNHVPINESKARKFYIGSQDTVDGIDARLLRGVAGTSFIEEQIHVAHVEYNGSRYALNHPDAIRNSDETSNPGYRAFICIPLLLGERKLGVLCVDSYDQEVFDNEAQQDYFAEIGVAFAGALAFCVGDIAAYPTASSLQSSKRRDIRNGNKKRFQERSGRRRVQQKRNATNNR